MLTISKVFTILCLHCQCGGIGNTIPWYLSKQIRKLFFQMSARVYFVPGQNEGGGKDFQEWTSMYLSSKISLKCGGNVNY